MDKRLNTIILQILLKIIALFAENRKQVIYVVPVIQTVRQRDFRIVYVVVIIRSNPLTIGIVFVQMFEFNIQNRSLNLV